MTSPATDDYPEAARKHLVDATALATARRFDGAAYLSGYVVECAAKLLIQVETASKPKNQNQRETNRHDRLDRRDNERFRRSCRDRRAHP